MLVIPDIHLFLPGLHHALVLLVLLLQLCAQQSWNRVRVSRVGSGSGRVRVGFGFRFGFRIGFGSGSGSNFVCNFLKFNDLILFFERLYLQ